MKKCLLLLLFVCSQISLFAYARLMQFEVQCADWGTWAPPGGMNIADFTVKIVVTQSDGSPRITLSSLENDKLWFDPTYMGYNMLYLNLQVGRYPEINLKDKLEITLSWKGYSATKTCSVEAPSATGDNDFGGADGLVLKAPDPEIKIAGGFQICSGVTTGKTTSQALTVTNAPAGATIKVVDGTNADITSKFTVTTTTLQINSTFAATTSGCKVLLMAADGTTKLAESSAFTVTVNTPAIFDNITADKTCSGQAMKLSATATGGTVSKWTWGGAATGSTASVTINNPAVGEQEYTVKGEDSNKCAMVEYKKKITINQTPVINSLTPSKNSVEVNTEFTLDALPTTYNKYEWTGNGVNNANNASTTAKPTATGSQKYTVIATSTEGCKSAAKEATVTVTAAGPGLAVNPTIPSTVCLGGAATQLDAGASGGKTPYKYQWTVTGGITLSALDVEKPTITNTTAVTGTIKVEVKDDNGAGAPVESTAKTVTINVKPTLSNIAANPSTINAGQTSALSVTVNPVGTTCTWSGGPFNGANTGTAVTAAPTATATYTVTAGAAGCQATLQTTVTVNTTPPDPTDCPTLNLTVSQMVCATTAGTAQRMITITGTGAAGTSYSFKVKDINGVETPYNGTQAFIHLVTEAKRGLHSITGLIVTKADGTTCNGTVPPAVDVQFYDLPAAPGVQGATQIAVGQYSLSHCGNDPLTLKGTGASGLNFVWNNGVGDGIPFVPAGSQNYTVTAINANGCSAQSTLAVTVNPKPTVTATATPTEICKGESVTLTSGGTAATYLWNNGGADNTPITPLATTKYTVTGTAANGCKDTASVTVIVNTAPEIIKQSKDRTIAIGRDADFSVDALGNGLTYKWQRMENGLWVDLTDGTASFPQISGAATNKVLLSKVPRTWDNTQLKCLVGNRCDTVEATFNLWVKECFEITGDIAMGAGIRPDEVPNDAIDGWYCLGTRITLQAKITPEDPANLIENPRYKWVIDGEPANKVIEQDSSILSWVPEFWEDDIVVKVGVYSDGACDTVYSKYLRLKARPFDDATVKIVATVDVLNKEGAACPGEQIDFTVATTNAGADPKFQWYNSIFNLGTGKNKTLTMKEATWVKVIMTPSPEVCVGDKVLSDSIHIVLKQDAKPTLKVTNSINDTLVCTGDEITFYANYEGAGKNPVIHWQKSVWNLGYGPQVTTKMDNNKDIDIKCELIPSKDVCYTGDTVSVIMTMRILENSSVSIFCDMDGKKPGDDLTFTSKVENVPLNPLYEWFVNGNLTNEPTNTYISNVLRQNDVVVMAVKGEKVCQTRLFSNEIVVNFNRSSRDTMVEIYKDERISKLNMFKTGDESSIFMIVEMPKYGQAVMFPNGLFDYYPNAGFMGQDFVRYTVTNRYDKTKTEEGYIYITVKGSGRYFIPNIITPNGDGLNDVWKLDFLSEYPDHIVTVFNWQSKIVFQAKNYQNDWDGKGQTSTGYVGQVNLPNGIYTYVIDLGNKVILKGWVEIRGGFNRTYYR